MTETHEISLMIHGTFARDEQWWKPGDGQSAADLLEKELAKRGHGGTVWLPAIESGMASDEFAWSGANTHAARIDGARQLADALRRLADRQSCTAVEPLAVNLVAHSHGGNVVLEALDMLPANVAIRRFVMLGTPMVWRRPSSRVYRIFNALTLPLFLLWLVLLALAPYAVEDPDPDLPSLWSTLLVIAILLSLYPRYLHWYTRLTAWVVRLFNSVFRPARLRGTAGYGPDPAALAEMAGGPVYHIGSREDEADLLLHFGASPFEVYQAFLKGRLRGILKWIERILVRPWFYVVVEPVVETALEHYALGFSWWKVLRNDYEMVSRSNGQRYPDTALQRIDVSNEILPALEAKLRSRPAVIETMAPSHLTTNGERHIEALRATAQSVTRDLVQQVRLRHSVYYESREVMARVAKLIAA